MDSAHIYQRGVTILELTIVMVIIGIFAAGVITAINIPVQLQRARDGQRKSDLLNVKSALEIYRTDQRSYPTTAQYNAVGCGQALTGGSPPSTYFQKKPCDPQNTGQYVYTYSSDGTTFTLVACLERYTDSQKDTSNNGTYCSGGTINWSYTVTNP